MSVAHVIASINQDIGGPASSVPALLRSLEEFHYKLHIFTLDYQQHGQMHELGRVKLHSFQTTLLSRLLRGFQLDLRTQLFQAAKTELSLIHSHGLWMYPNTVARVAAKRYDLPLVISPRGMLEPWARKRAEWKKKTAWFLYERKNIDSADLFHVTAQSELRSLREFGITQPIAVIPNGVALPKVESIPKKSFIDRFSPNLSQKKWVLFLSRLDPKKGTDTLLRVWKQVHQDFPEHILVIAGPDLIGWRKELEKYVFDNRLNKHVVFTGSAQSDLKACLLAHADLFVLPTHSENFGNVIAESLSYGTPVITTWGSPWESLLDTESGWWIENTEETLASTLRDALSLHPLTLDQMGQHGRKMVKERFAWEKIASDFDALYRWSINGEQPPSLIDFKE